MKFGLGVCALLCASLLMAGCGPGGPPTVPVTGTITKGGQPLANITVTLVDSAKPDNTATGTSDSAGKFDLVYGTIGKRGAVPGKYKVVLSGGGGDAVKGADYKGGGAYGPQGGGARQSAAPVVETPYDKTWTSVETSTMEVEVKSGMPEVKIEIP